MLFRTFAGFHGLLCAQFYAILAQILQTKQALSLQQGRRQDERPSMLFRTFAVYITLGFTFHAEGRMYSKLRILILCAIVAAIPVGGLAQGLRDAKVAFSSGNWKVLRSTDPMKDTTNCTGIYKENYSVQLTPEKLFIGIQGGIQSVTLRFGEKPARGLRLAEDMEKKIRSVIISGSDFAELVDSDRLRYQVSTLVSGIKTDELDLTGLRAALENIRSGCPIQAGTSAPAESRASLTGSLCSAVLVSRMKAQGLKDEQIFAICQ
jgi:hypothetical protein